MKCPKCGTEFTTKYCPNCGGKGKKPIYKRVWFWVLVILLVFIIAGAIGSGGSETEKGTAVQESAVAEQTTDNGENDSKKESAEEPEEDIPEEPKVVSISAEYLGGTEEGTVLGENKDDFYVKATFDDGSEDYVSDWTIVNEKALQAGKTTTVTIKYEGVSCKVQVKCTTMSEEAYKAQCQEIEYKDLARNPDDYTGEFLKISGEVIQVLEDGDELTLRVATADYYDDIFLVSYSYKDGESRILEDDQVTLWGMYYGTYTYESTLGGNITVPCLLAEYVDIEE